MLIICTAEIADEANKQQQIVENTQPTAVIPEQESITDDDSELLTVTTQDTTTAEKGAVPEIHLKVKVSLVILYFPNTVPLESL